MRQQTFYRKSWYSPLRHIFSRYPKHSETQKDSSTNRFVTVRQNNLTENRDTGLLSYRLIFPYQKFFQIQKGSSTNFLRTLRQNFLTEKRGNASLRPSLFSIIFFDTIVFVEHRRVPLWNFSVLRENIFCMEDRDKTFSSRKFSIPYFESTLMGSPTKLFATVRQQIFYRKSLYALLRYKFFRYLKLSETQKDSSTKWFGTVRQNNLTENRDTGLLSYRFFFDTRIFFKYRRGPLRITLRRKLLTEKRGNASLRPSFFSILFFDTIFFLEHRRVPLWSFSVLREDIFSMEDRDITFSSRKFWIPCFESTLMGSPTKLFATVRQQIFYRKSLYSLLRHKFFRYSKLSETEKLSSTKWFGTVRQNNLTENRDTGLLSYRFFFDTRFFVKHRRGPLR